MIRRRRHSCGFVYKVTEDRSIRGAAVIGAIDDLIKASPIRVANPCDLIQLKMWAIPERPEREPNCLRDEATWLGSAK